MLFFDSDYIIAGSLALSKEDRRSISNPDIKEAEMGVFMNPSTIENYNLRDGDVVKALICSTQGKSMWLAGKSLGELRSFVVLKTSLQINAFSDVNSLTLWFVPEYPLTGSRNPSHAKRNKNPYEHCQRTQHHSRIVKKVLHVDRASEEFIRNWSFALEGLVETFSEKVGGAAWSGSQISWVLVAAIITQICLQLFVYRFRMISMGLTWFLIFKTWCGFGSLKGYGFLRPAEDSCELFREKGCGEGASPKMWSKITWIRLWYTLKLFK